ncbi:acyl-CoA carboxylase subunit epsilon [Streptomyces sp. NPDC002990]
MSNDVPIASLLRVEKGVAAPEELAAIAVVVACYARRTTGKAVEGAGCVLHRRRPGWRNASCWASCWACR